MFAFVGLFTSCRLYFGFPTFFVPWTALHFLNGNGKTVARKRNGNFFDPYCIYRFTTVIQILRIVYIPFYARLLSFIFVYTKIFAFVGLFTSCRLFRVLYVIDLQNWLNSQNSELLDETCSVSDQQKV